MSDYEQIPLYTADEIVRAPLPLPEKRWFNVVVRTLVGDGFTVAEAEEFVSKTIYVGGKNPGTSFRDILDAMDQASRKVGRALWLRNSYVHEMSAAIANGADPYRAAEEAAKTANFQVASQGQAFELTPTQKAQFVALIERFNRLCIEMTGMSPDELRAGTTFPEGPSLEADTKLAEQVIAWTHQVGGTVDDAWRNFVYRKKGGPVHPNITRHFYLMFKEQGIRSEVLASDVAVVGELPDAALEAAQEAAQEAALSGIGLEKALEDFLESQGESLHPATAEVFRTMFEALKLQMRRSKP
jgi:hypothetical protein